MPLLSRKGILAIAAVIDVAQHAGDKPVSARSLASRHGLPPRHLEPVLQALVHSGILKGIRGPRGGYALGREPSAINAEEILRAAGSVEETSELPNRVSDLVVSVVMPALTEAERAFALALREIDLRALMRRADGLKPR